MLNKDRLRRSMMFLPGNAPAKLIDAHIYGSDSIMIDLEDAVSISAKDAARMLTYETLKKINYGTTEVVVRINALNSPYGRDDVIAMVSAGAQVIRLPKTDNANEVKEVDELISEIEYKLNRPKKTLILAAIESASGVINACEIAKASDRLMGIALGAEDYVTNLKTTRSKHAMELYYAREQIVHAARSNDLYCFDTVFSDIKDKAAFAEEVQFIKDLGFDGKSVIHPSQIKIVHDIYAPKEKEIINAIKVVNAAKEAEKNNIGVISVDGKMVDRPIIIRALRVIELAKASGLYKEEF